MATIAGAFENFFFLVMDHEDAEFLRRLVGRQVIPTLGADQYANHRIYHAMAHMPMWPRLDANRQYMNAPVAARMERNYAQAYGRYRPIQIIEDPHWVWQDAWIAGGNNAGAGGQGRQVPPGQPG